MQHRHLSGLALSALLAASSLSYAQSGSPGFEAAPTLPGAELVHPTLLAGPLYKLAEPVKVEGYLGSFVIESRFGRFSVRGAQMLAVRVSELHAIEELQKVHKDAAFKDALAKSAGGVAKFAEETVRDPGKTVENLGKGVGTVFGRVGYLAHSGVDYLSDKASDATSGRSKPEQRSAPSGEPEPPAFTGDPFGYNMARREWAKKLQIDPYTSNPVLRPLLDDAATATFAGNFSVSLMLGAVATPLQYAHELDDTVRQSVWNKPALDLERENQEKLQALGVPDRTVRELLRNRWFTPTLQTALVARLESLGRLPGIESVVTAAVTTQGEPRARFLLESLAMLATHQEKGGRFSKLRMSNLVPVGVAADGAVVVAVAIDYGTWDRDAAALLQRKEFSAPKKTLLVAGKLSPRARAALDKAGWKMRTGLRG